MFFSDATQPAIQLPNEDDEDDEDGVLSLSYPSFLHSYVENVCGRRGGQFPPAGGGGEGILLAELEGELEDDELKVQPPPPASLSASQLRRRPTRSRSKAPPTAFGTPFQTDSLVSRSKSAYLGVKEEQLKSLVQVGSLVSLLKNKT